MTLASGTRLGPYEVVSWIGAGAMGVVYKARDSRLGRDVAIKVLPPVFAQDPDRLARFEREARAVAAINHPNIVSVHDVGDAEITDPAGSAERVAYLITELLDGDTLRARLAQGPLTPRLAVDVAMQVAQGLAAAHDRDIVHRDLKPENIVLLRDGRVKILDFGLAKQAGPPAGSDEQQTMAATDAGTVLGTVGYMAPEQVRGEPSDPRSDLFALGAVLHELVSGTRAFARPTAAETMSAILRDDPPDLLAQSGTLPPGLARIVRHALEKDPDHRFQSARDFAFALQAFADTAVSGSGPVLPVPPRIGGRTSRPLMALAAFVALAAAIAGAIHWWPAAGPASAHGSMIFAPVLPYSDPALSSPAISPDGTRIAFIARTRAGGAVAVRRLDTNSIRVLKGTDGARAGGVFWSPDGQSLGFFASGKLKVITVAGEKVDELANAPSANGGTWGSDDTILFSPDERGPILRVSARGGGPTPVTTLDPDRHDDAHRWPQFLPDGRHFVFLPWNQGTTTRMLQIGSLDGGAPVPLFEAESGAVVAGGYYIFVRDRPSRLMAQAFDPRTFAPVGRPDPIVADDNIDYFWFSGEPLVSASSDLLIYTTAKLRTAQLTWVNRAGRPLGTVGDAEVFYDPTLSPDGTMLAVEKRDPDRDATDLWTVDLARGVFSRLTSTSGFESVACWSPNGQQIAFGSDSGQGPKLWLKNASGAGSDTALVTGRLYPMSWSRDGRRILLAGHGGATRQDVWVYDTERHESTPLLTSPFNETGPTFSPDGRWIAYASDETRVPQVYVQSFPDGATRTQVSTAGGRAPAWRGDGHELFYLAPDTTLMSVDVSLAGSKPVIGAPQPLFATNSDPDRVIRTTYAAASDGQRFLVMTPLVHPTASAMVGVLNWTAGIAKR